VGARRKIVDNFEGSALEGRSLILAQHAEQLRRSDPVAPADSQHAHWQPALPRELQDRRALLPKHQPDDRSDRDRRVLRRIRDQAGSGRP
jgi:hypothetical protein